MLVTISWQQYVVAIIIITALYYAYIVIRYYQSDITHLFYRNKISVDALTDLSAADRSVIGPARPEDGITISDVRELLFSSDDSAILDNEVQTPGSNSGVPAEKRKNFWSETNQLIDAFMEVDDKATFLSLLKVLAESYKSTEEDIDLPAMLSRLMETAKEKLKFPIGLTDLQDILV